MAHQFTLKSKDYIWALVSYKQLPIFLQSLLFMLLHACIIHVKWNDMSILTFHTFTTYVFSSKQIHHWQNNCVILHQNMINKNTVDVHFAVIGVRNDSRSKETPRIQVCANNYYTSLLLILRIVELIFFSFLFLSTKYFHKYTVYAINQVHLSSYKYFQFSLT